MQHLEPKDFLQTPAPEKTGFIRVPGYWGDFKLKGKELPGEGYATYRLKILLKAPNENLALRFTTMGTAFSAYVNGKKVASAGVPGTDRSTTKPQFIPQVADFVPKERGVDLLLHVSNFHHRRAGAWEAITLGTEKDIRKLSERRVAFDLFLFGSIFIIGMYHVGLFILRRKDRSPLYFSIFCFLMAVRILTIEERYLIHLFPKMNWEFMVKLEYVSFYLAIPVFALFMRSVFQYIEAICTSPRPVLITGETGVGKELVARAVHALSGRKGRFVPVNVAGLDDNVFADTLFGHKKGAFTGADQARSGLLEQASGGSLFLDEIGDLHAASQVKLLRLLQDGEVFPLGSDVPKRSDARVVVATNQNLGALEASGTFRKDLYYRLCDHHVHIPPLRERLEDLPLLGEHFLEKASKTLNKKKPTPPDELVTLLCTYDFPGNIRELESMIIDAVSAHKAGKLSMEAFKGHIFKDRIPREQELPKEPRTFMSFPEKLPTLKQAEDLLIREALERAEGNQSIAALYLGISRQALNKRLRKKGA
jgi:transcriptional regulator with AAA-type ATPase domain